MNLICRVFGHRTFTFSLRGYEEGVCVRCWREGGLRIVVTTKPKKVPGSTVRTESDRYLYLPNGRVYDSVTDTWADSKPKTQGNDTATVTAWAGGIGRDTSGSQG